MSQPVKRCYAFGEFRLDVAERRLLRNGETIPLTPKVFDTLLLLVENSGHLVEKDEFMKRLWPATFVGEDALARNIFLLRKAVGETADSEALIATVPTRGYRFLGNVTEIGQPHQDAQEKEPAETSHVPRERTTTEEKDRLGGRFPAAETIASDGAGAREGSVTREPAVSGSRRGRTALVVIALAVGSLAGLVTFLLLSPAPTPRVIRSTQITHSGRVEIWGGLASDGARIYFLERDGDHWNLAQTSTGGGEPQLLAAPFRNTVILDASPDRTELLVASFIQRGPEMPVWLWPVQGGAPTRLGDVVAGAATWWPGGQRIVYAHGTDLYLIDRDGSNNRRFVSTRGAPASFAWSPDGRALRFTVWNADRTSPSIWEVASDGTRLHRILEGWNNPPDECCGKWTSDGKYFLFQSSRGGKENIWALREKPSISARNRKPVQLTVGPGGFLVPLTDRTKGRAYVVVSNPHTGWVRFDPNSHEFVPILEDVRGSSLSYSKDGQWMAYVTFPDGTLWRSRADGSQRVQLTLPPLQTNNPQWSPDGKQIVFYGWTQGQPPRIYLVSSEGGKPKELVADKRGQWRPTWSPDGKSIAYELSEDSRATGGVQTIHVFQLASQQDAKLPAPEGLIGPAWSPDGNYLGAATEGQHELMIFSFATQKWTRLMQGTLLSGPIWHKDGRSFFVQDLLEAGQPIYRVRLNDGARERVVDFGPLLRTGVQRCAFIGLSPEGDPIAWLTHSSTDIEALDLDLP